MPSPNPTISVSDLLSLPSLVQRIEKLERRLCEDNRLQEENESLKEENESLRRELESEASRREEAEYMTIWDQESRKILSIADLRDQRR